MSELVTLGMPVFNGEPFVAESLASLLAQDHDPLEILVADNASPLKTGIPSVTSSLIGPTAP